MREVLSFEDHGPSKASEGLATLMYPTQQNDSLLWFLLLVPSHVSSTVLSVTGSLWHGNEALSSISRRDSRDIASDTCSLIFTITRRKFFLGVKCSSSCVRCEHAMVFNAANHLEAQRSAN